jgi:hypothetical protein
MIEQIQSNFSSFIRLANRDCLNVYSNLYQSTYTDLIMVTSDPPIVESNNATNSLLAWGQSRNTDTGQWLCATPQNCTGVGNIPYNMPIYGGTFDDRPGTPCDFKKLNKDPERWTNFGHPIQYCLARPSPSYCDLMMNTVLTKAVIEANAAALAIMLLFLIAYRKEMNEFLSCPGDVIASYLNREEVTTQGMCLSSKAEVETFWQFRGRAAVVETKKHRWYHTMTTSRCFLLIGLIFVGVLVSFIGLVYSLYHAKQELHLDISPSGLLNLGFGSAIASMALNLNVQSAYGATSYRVSILAVISNLPQLFLTITTFVCTVALIEMAQAASYSRFALKAKTLRVSNPTGAQRGLYFFGMPVRWAIPFLALGAVLQYVVSQALLPISVVTDNPNGPNGDTGSTFDDLAFSPLAVVVSFVMMVVFAAFILGLCSRKLKGPMPLASGSSLALSAAVHPLRTQPEATSCKLKWGVVGRAYHDDTVVHCSFSADAVEHLQLGDRAL